MLHNTLKLTGGGVIPVGSLLHMSRVLPNQPQISSSIKHVKENDMVVTFFSKRPASTVSVINFYTSMKVDTRIDHQNEINGKLVLSG